MNQQPNNPIDDDFDKEIMQSLLRKGAAFPTTPAQVSAAKNRLARAGANLPERLNNASKICPALLAGEVRGPDNVIWMPLNPFAEAKEELMRAARNGKESISAKIEDKMRENRTKARASNG